MFQAAVEASLQLNPSKGFGLLQRNAAAIAEFNERIEYVEQFLRLVSAKRKVGVGKALDRRRSASGKYGSSPIALSLNNSSTIAIA